MTSHILIVEDDEMVQSFIALHLENEGYGVSKAATGGEGLDILARENIDLILLDLNLPDGDGLSIAQRVREVSSVPIIVLTARKGQDDRLIALGLGADEYLTKPVDPKELFLRVRNLLKRAGTASSTPQPAVLPVSAESRREEPGVEAQKGKTSGPGTAVPPKRGGLSALVIVLALFAVTLSGVVFWYFVEIPKLLPSPEQAESPPAMAPAKAAQEPSKDGPKARQAAATGKALAPVDIPDEEPTKAMAEMLGYGWVLKSQCGSVPKVEWWKYKDHESIAGYVHRKHKGDWAPYIEKWFQRLIKLQDINNRKSSAVTNTGAVLKGPELIAYIKKMEKRLSVTRCLAQEAKKFSSASPQPR